MNWRDKPCKPWTGATNKVSGYGVRRFQGKATTAHRVAFFLEHGRWHREELVAAGVVRVLVRREGLPCFRLRSRLRFLPSDVYLWAQRRGREGR